MNKEKSIQLRLLYSLLTLVGFAFMYAWGGIEMKFIRRFIAPSWLAMWAYFLSGRDWRYFIQLPFNFMSLSLGYGGDTLGIKILRRAIFGMSNGISFSIVNLWDKKVLLSLFNLGLVSLSFIVLGVFNPMPNARAEETILGLLIAIVPILSIRSRRIK